MPCRHTLSNLHAVRHFVAMADEPGVIRTGDDEAPADEI